MTVVPAPSKEGTEVGQVTEVETKEPEAVVLEKEEEEEEEVYVSSEDELDLKLSSPLIPMEGDRGCPQAGCHKDKELRPTTYQLCTYEESPAYLQHNPFIHKGYRVNFSFRLCLHSLFRLHNESWNIWTHLFGFAVFLWLGARLVSVMEWRMVGEPFHAFNCHSPCTYKWTCRFDYSSISMLVVGSYSPMLYYAFICEPFWQRLYLASFLVLGISGVIISFLPFFSTPQYRVYRTCVFLGLGWSTLMPLPHMLYSHGLWAVWQIARWELLVGLIYSVGAVVYAKRVPERWYPGRYDFSVMGSHSLWHCFTIVGALVQLHACISVYEAFGTLFVCA